MEFDKQAECGHRIHGVDLFWTANVWNSAAECATGLSGSAERSGREPALQQLPALQWFVQQRPLRWRALGRISRRRQTTLICTFNALAEHPSLSAAGAYIMCGRNMREFGSSKKETTPSSFPEKLLRCQRGCLQFLSVDASCAHAYYPIEVPGPPNSSFSHRLEGTFSQRSRPAGS